MATMEAIVNSVLTQLRFATGRDVQIHLQDGIAQDASILYRTLMMKYWWRDYRRAAIIDTAVNGTPSPVLVDDDFDSTKTLTRFSDILGVYKENDPVAFPFSSNSSRYLLYKTPTVSPHPTAVFFISPQQVYNNLTVHFRSWQEEDFGLDDEVPFYKDLLVLGTAHLLCMKSGINKELTDALKQQFEALVMTYRMDEVKPQYSTITRYGGGIPTEWFVP